MKVGQKEMASKSTVKYFLGRKFLNLCVRINMGFRLSNNAEKRKSISFFSYSTLTLASYDKIGGR